MANELPSGWSVRPDLNPRKARVEQALRTARPTPELLKDSPAKARGREGPSVGDYARAVGSSVKRAVPGAAQLLGLVPGAVRAAGEYLGTHTPGEVASDAGELAVRAGRHIAEHPVATLADLTPVVGDVKGYVENIRDAANARRAGDLETAHMYESMALPLVAAGLIPELGAGALAVAKRGVRGAAEAARPEFTVRQQGNDLLVRRRGADIPTVPSAAKARTLDDLRVLTRDPATNPALRLAQSEAERVHGVPLDMERMPQTSLAKQAGIGRVFRAAVEDAPGYKHSVFERYGELMPEVVERAKAQNYDDLLGAAYEDLGKSTQEQFDQLPVSMRYHEGDKEYPTPSAMMRDVLANGNLNVFRGGEPHEFLSRIDPQTGLSLNEMFRGVHDYMGHVAPGSTFRPGGEEIAYAVHHRTLPPLSQIALLSETRGQNSFVNYSPINAQVIRRQKELRAEQEADQLAARMRGEKFIPDPRTAAQLRELAERYQYAPQRSVLLPPEYLDPMTQGGVPDYLRSVIRPSAPSDAERAVHLSTTEGLSRTDPTYYGTGHRGEDWRNNSGIPRTHFYLGPEGTVVPEQMVANVAPHPYEATLSGLYDIAADPEGLVELARAYNTPLRRSAIPDFERLARDYGYSGFSDKHAHGRSAGVFDPVDLRSIAGARAPYADGGLVE